MTTTLVSLLKELVYVDPNLSIKDALKLARALDAVLPSSKQDGAVR